MADAKVIARQLTKRYGNFTAVDGVDLTVHSGEIFGLLGPNGAGKTTTIEMMEGIRKPDAGTCTISGFDSIAQNDRVRERIGLTLQAANMPEAAKVGEMLELYASLYADPIRPGDLLQQFNLVEKVHSTCKSLSGGQRQRLSLAMALVGRPEVLFLDEPTTGLDPQARHSLWDVIRGLKAEGRAVIMSTHYMEEAEKLCDRVAIMDRGKILAEGTPRELIRAYGPEAAIEVDVNGYPVNLAEIAQLSAVTGVQTEDHLLVLSTANTAASLMAFAGYVQANNIPLGDLRTRSATMEDVFMALTGRRLRD